MAEQTTRVQPSGVVAECLVNRDRLGPLSIAGLQFRYEGGAIAGAQPSAATMNRSTRDAW
jgi:hypothetical protein